MEIILQSVPFIVPVLALFAGLLGLIVAILKIRQLQLELKKLKPKNNPEIIRPSITQIIEFGGDIGQLYSRLREKQKDQLQREAENRGKDTLFAINPWGILGEVVSYAVLPARQFVRFLFPPDVTISRNELLSMSRNDNLLNGARLIIGISAFIVFVNLTSLFWAAILAIITQASLFFVIWSLRTNIFTNRPRILPELEMDLLGDELIVWGKADSRRTKRPFAGAVEIILLDKSGRIDSKLAYLESHSNRNTNSENKFTYFSVTFPLSIPDKTNLTAEVGRTFFD
ncbi:MAG: hypothetical protein WBD64_08415 [Candidatus Zixiibacteriota bacterium]